MDLSTLGNVLDNKAEAEQLEQEDGSAAINDSAALGVDPSEVRTSKVTLCTLLLDDSGSMEWTVETLTGAVMRAIDEIKNVTSRHDVLVGVYSLWHGWLMAYTRVEDAKFDARTYRPDGPLTPLFDKVLELLAAIEEKQSQLSEAGVPARSISLILTDGGDNDSSVEELAVRKRMTAFTERSANTVYGLAFGSAAEGVLQEIGIPDRMVKEASSTLELQEAFAAFSRATSAAASGAKAPAGLTIA